MCGICGIAGERAEAAGPALGRMMAAMRHRGPDDSGELLAPRVALGSRRLSIIDLPGGRQPIAGEDGRVAVVFNGEIYNFRELRRELESLGHRFRTQSDTEIIVHAYEAWGEECVNRLDGMFAFAVASFRDPERQEPLTLFLARDRFGIKPFYYTLKDERLLFASEVRALLASGAMEARVEPRALATYLLFGSLSEPNTLIEGLLSLPPAHRVTIRLDRPIREIQARPYWNLAEAVKRRRESLPASREEAVRGTRERLEGAVRSHLLADVPVGVFLSSGMDSMTLAALANRESPGVYTFTLVFDEREYNEADPAREFAGRLGTVHEELRIGGDEVLASYQDALRSLDLPSMDGVNTYFVSRGARRAGLKVALSGLGGDELFGGYDTFRNTRLGSWPAQKLPRGARQAAAGLLEISAGWTHRPDRSRKLASLLRQPERLPHPYFFTRMLFPPGEVEKLVPEAGGFAGEEWLRRAALEAGGSDDFGAVSQLELRTYLPNTLLRDTDSASMANSLEVRVPLLDRELAEYVLALPERWKMRRGAPKSLLADAAGNLLPPEIAAQPKRTFTLPWERWLRGPLQAEVEAGIGDLAPSLDPFLDRIRVRRIWKAFLGRRTSWSRPWSLYVLNEWARRSLDSGVSCPIAEEIGAAPNRSGGGR
ncbi:MAG TPA: asparagine synthase (glutamine-hydrolyzing) [Patescibacteria group bacterium]|nr:asparagine synthase (glutamine-hydrolyzing) [Patescibacteria group bacterium]